MKSKTVINTLYAAEMDMGGIPVRQALPVQSIDHIGPFILLHHGSFPVQKGRNPLHMGVGPHPHRGFAPLTLVVKGEVHHRDSLGNSGVIGRGGIQYVQAGRGIIHSERPSAQLAEKGGEMEVIQLWINVPAAHKMDPALYIAETEENLPKIGLGHGTELHLIAGNYANAAGPVKPLSPLTIARLEMESGSTAELLLPDGIPAAVYCIDGEGRIGEFGNFESLNLYHFSASGTSIWIEARNKVELLVLSGEEINEPMAQYGPFVMNTQTQIMEALRDHQMGKMGILIEEN